MLLSLPISKWLGAACLLALAAAVPAVAQTTAPDSTANKVYTYVEKMPQLPGGGGTAAIVRSIQQRVRYPHAALLARAQGRVYVRFTIEADGVVRQIAIVKGFRPDCDSAVVQAVRQLPRFEPGIQAGKPVPVSMAMPVTFALTVTQLPPTTRP